MKIGLIGDINYKKSEIVNAILSNPSYELIYFNACCSNPYDKSLEVFCDDLDIIFTMFNNIENNNYFLNRYEKKVKPINLDDTLNKLLAS